MKKAFEQNVSRAKPRLRLGALTGMAEPTEDPAEADAPEALAESPAPASSEPTAPSVPDLSSEVRARVERARAPRPTVSEALRAALSEPPSAVAVGALRSPELAHRAPAEPLLPAAPPRPPPSRPQQEEDEDDFSIASYEAPPSPVASAQLTAPAHSGQPAPVAHPAYAAYAVQPAPGAYAAQPAPAAYSAPGAYAAQPSAPVARVEAPHPEVEVQTPSAPRTDGLETEARRSRLKERLKAVRENPRPEPLPASVAEAGLRAVERITTLQSELTRVKAVNLTLTQELEVVRRQAEKATEEARLRMDEARRLSSEMEGRLKLLAELERELATLEGERDEVLLSLQETRQALEAAARERQTLEVEVAHGRQSLADSLAEEERLAGELELAKDDSSTLRRAVEMLQGERDVLAQQVASLTAERAELLEARKALEAVHRALSQATVR